MLEKAIKLGTALARSLGHAVNCPQCPCNCGGGQEQAQALADWQHFLEEIKDASTLGNQDRGGAGASAAARRD